MSVIGKHSMVLVPCVFLLLLSVAMVNGNDDDTGVVDDLEQEEDMSLGGVLKWLTARETEKRRKRSTDGLSALQKNAILAIHNSLRDTVVPAASNMQTMTWSDVLADIAQNYANQCQFAHNPDRSNNSSNFSYVGENLYASTSDSDIATISVQKWFDEKADYDYDSNSCASGKMCGHYTQVVWANSNKLGCGLKKCSPITGINWKSGYFVVCNYGPGGNIGKQRPYNNETAPRQS